MKSLEKGKSLSTVQVCGRDNIFLWMVNERVTFAVQKWYIKE